MTDLAHGSQFYRSVAAFRRFLEGRSDKERWELHDGVAVRLQRPTLGHQAVLSNLRRLLDDALEIHAPKLTAYVWIGVNLTSAVENYDLLPDIIVTDVSAAEQPDASYVDRVFLVAEIAESSERTILEIKRGLYKGHAACNCILTVQQDSGWEEHVLTNPDDLLVLPEFGLRCKVSDLYRGTSLLPRQASKH